MKAKFYVELLGYGERNFVRGIWVTIPRLPPRPYMVKTLQKPRSDFDLFYGKVKFYSLGFLVGI